MLRDLLGHSTLIWRLAKSEFFGRYSGSVLGVVWSVIDPLIMVVMYTMIFAVVLKVRVGGAGGVTDFGLFLVSGMIAFGTVVEAIRRSIGVYSEQAHLLRRIPMPPVVLPAARVLSSLLDQLITLALFVVLLFVLRKPPGFSALGLLVLLPLQVMMGIGISLAVASLSVLLHDIRSLTEALLTIWFLGTPVFYPRELLPEGLRRVVDANPMTPLVEGYRAMLLHDCLPSLPQMVYFAGAASLFFLVGWGVYHRTRAMIIDQI